MKLSILAISTLTTLAISTPAPPFPGTSTIKTNNGWGDVPPSIIPRILQIPTAQGKATNVCLNHPDLKGGVVQGACCTLGVDQMCFE